jgi:FMN phosphatase YigB (HAD superfamily)
MQSTEERKISDLVVFIDVDNTLLDSDKLVADFRIHLKRELGPFDSDRYWTLFAGRLKELGYVDYLGALQALSIQGGQRNLENPRILRMAEFLLDYPFAELVYPKAFDAITHLKNYGVTVILSDGDVVLQPRKILRSGLWDAVDGRVLIYVHKEFMLNAMKSSYPASHYVMIDDKPRLLHAMKTILTQRLTTIMPRQGHYALDVASVASYPAADLIVANIGDLANFDLPAILVNKNNETLN